ncbi:hypothetical protein MARPU_05730 [Marichromatium purpuratum 984]|uniref:DUF4124 domain-containing protein n=1 Tax=Marichromatium purpuratum 984 TaxID=765910 RepID=W0E857_MARPU|nr:DUF4124 domain-containing protein [Marichromatium purpuratum]AHF05414.1 hypothetical protein MARPU_05730 [Marichromatium purpuratum 984]
MRWMVVAATAAAAVWCGAGLAGVYKCTNPETGAVTFSQTPCPGESERIEVRSASAPDQSRPTIEALAEICVKEGSFKDPASVELVEIGTMGAEVITYASHRIVAHRLPIKVNARNGYGGYVGAEWYHCYLSRATSKVFMVVSAE